MGRTGCAVPNCQPNKRAARYRFPHPTYGKDLMLTWLRIINNEKLKNLDFDVIYKNYRVCDKHFMQQDRTTNNRLGNMALPQLHVPLNKPEPSSPVSDMLEPNINYITESLGDDIGTDNITDLFQSSKDSDEVCEATISDTHIENASVTIKSEGGDEDVIKYQCRTCLNTTDASSSSSVTEVLFLDRTIKDVIVFLVPELDSKLKDDELVCEECLIILDSTTKFILRCLEAEAILTRQKNTNGVNSAQEPVVVESQNEDEEIKEQIDVDHDYCFQTLSAGEDVEDIKENICDLDQAVETSTGNNNIKIEYYDLSTFDNNGEIKEDNSSSYPMETLEEFLQNNDEGNLEEDIGEIENCASSLNKIPTVTNLEDDTYQKTKVKEKESFSCLTCLEIFTDKEKYDNHLQVHPPHICEICGKGFKRKDSFRMHKLTHNDPNSYICEVCGKGFKENGALRSHLKNHTGEELCICDKCSKTFKNRRLLDIHIKYVHDKAYSTQCTICGKLSRNETSLRAHIKLVHMKEKPFECNICHKKFGRADYLHNHVMRHTGERWITDKQSPSGNRMVKRRTRLRYKIQDTGEPVPCKFCGQWYKDLVRLKRHLETHLKRYPCQFCPLTFPRNILRKRHEEIHRGGTVNFSRCNVCWKKFKTKEALDEHVACHNNPQHFCDLCGKTFNRKYLLSQHKLMEHSNIPEKDQPEEIIYDSLLEVGGLSM